MKQLHGRNVIFAATTIAIFATQPVMAQVSQVTNVQIKQVDGAINIVLKTSTSTRPQVFTTQRGKTLVADLINTQLRLSQGNNFREDNPMPGIASVEVSQLDANSVRVIVTGEKGTPSSQPVVRSADKITLGFAPGDGTVAATPTPGETPREMNPEPAAPAAPNPQVNISNTPAAPAGVGQSQTQAPPFLPRAVAPPVGDIAISHMDASPSVVDLGSQERVPRLVLRDAPVREVLSLLARAANLNLAYVGTANPAQSTPGQANSGNDGPTISLDIQNEPVQDVFNYVLRLSNLEANRSGRTVFVGPKLPNSARDVVMRNIRLNQVKVDTALSFLVALGAESAITREKLVTSVNAVPVGGAANTAVTQTQTTTELQVDTLRTEYQDSTPLLRGLQASGDQRTNSVTLVGPPRLIEVAMAQLTQLDIRRRQVAINVKIIDVNLLNIKDINTSFSFGVGKNYFVNDSGTAFLNFGNRTPIGDNNGSLNIGNRLDTFPKRFLASLQAQITNGNAKVLTDPTMTVQEGEQALVKLTSQVYAGLKESSSSTSTQSSTTKEPIIKDAGLSLSVKVDRVDDNGFVSLSVAPTVSAPSSTVSVPGSGDITLLAERSLTSGLVRLRDGQTLILSGIIQDTDRVSVSKVPILGDIPLLGSLFRKTNKQNQRQEVIVLLTPQIMDDSERSSYGYNYTPSPEVREMLERRGLKVPR
ncbi:type IV pilus secretin family protein [Calothrix sp. 336/3]|uniref:type IV pilus secretin family protein n=1 Tax=Calothrix sp. 336/3 TaxID=1337936 RepID=UPI0004E43366|nr:type IV pilus secretin family protein [Calothrix sp. 336/3]AKG22435.1 hypothetical protein IJ00_15195 [Calothrix sp. 336/3]